MFDWCFERLIFDWQLNFSSADHPNFKLRIDDKLMFDWCWGNIDFWLTTGTLLCWPSQFQTDSWWTIDVWLMLTKDWFMIDNSTSALLAVTISNWELMTNLCLIDVDERLILIDNSTSSQLAVTISNWYLMKKWCWLMLRKIDFYDAMQVNKLFFSFSLSSKFSIFWKMTIYYPLNVPDVTSVARCDQLVSDLTNWFQMWPIVARCDQLFPSVTSVKVWPAVAMCDQEWPTGFRCKQVVKFVPRCCQVWLTVARCDQLVSDVTSWSKLWPAGARCDKLLPCEQITRFCPVWPAIARYDFIVYFEITLLFITQIVDILYHKGARALKDFGSWFHQEGCI